MAPSTGRDGDNADTQSPHTHLDSAEHSARPNGNRFDQAGSSWSFTLYAGFVAFACYFCMYGLRKPIDAIVMAGEKYPGTLLDLKTACVLGQIAGYVLSKYAGARICSQASRLQRAWLLVVAGIIAEVAFLAFALSPAWFRPALSFANGLPLGIVWGLVVRHLEGRRTSDLMLVMLSGSYILAGAFTKDTCLWLMEHVPLTEAWAPATTGLLFLGPYLFFVYLLNRLPQPNHRDIEDRIARVDLDAAGRRAFLKQMGWGFGPLLASYFLLTAYREFRDHYGREILSGLEQASFPGIFVWTERWSLFAALGSLGLVNWIRDHTRALNAVLAFVVGGFATIGLATLIFQFNGCSTLVWMTLVGMGLYLAYVPFGTVLFERLVAASRFAGTSVFAVQLADGIGYTGSFLVQLCRDLFFSGFNRSEFFLGLSWLVSVLGVTLALAGFVSVQAKFKRLGNSPGQ